MKVKSKYLLLSCMSVVSISAMAIETEGITQRALERVTANEYQHGGWDGQHVNSTLVDSLSSHDDIVGARADGDVVINNNYNTPINIVNAPDQNGAAIDCKHPSYVKLCAELSKLTAPPPIVPVTGVWHLVGSRSSKSTAKLSFTPKYTSDVAKPKKMRLNGSIVIGYTGSATAYKYSQHYGGVSDNGYVYSSCWAPIGSNYVTGCTGNTVRVITSETCIPHRDGPDRCSDNYGNWNSSFTLNKIELMY